MEKIMINTYKVAARLPLGRIASFVNLRQDASWRDYLKFDESEVEKVLKYASRAKAVYLYKYGCVSFINFSQDEVTAFLDYLGTLYIDLSYELLSRFNDSHEIIPLSEDELILWEGDEVIFQYQPYVNDVSAAVLAKSTELYNIEKELSQVLDEAGNFIARLNKGYLRANTKKVAATLAQSIRFKYRSIESVRLLDRPSEFNRTHESKLLFDRLSGYFELKKRYEALANQMNILDSITGEYFSFGTKQSEQRLLLFEIVLLASFPLMHLLSH